MSRGNLPNEPPLTPPRNDTHPQYVTVYVDHLCLTVEIEWGVDYDEGQRHPLWTIFNVEIADYDDPKLRERVWEELF